MNERKMIIMKGIPGSGKDYTANTLAPKENIFSTDDFWMKDGKYVFVPALLGKAHQWNMDRVHDALKEGKSPVIVNNTNIKKRDYAPYLSFAKKFGYDVEVVMPTSPWWKEIYPRIKDGTFTDKDVMEFFVRNTHNVPFEAIKRMMDNWQE